MWEHPRSTHGTPSQSAALHYSKFTMPSRALHDGFACVSKSDLQACLALCDAKAMHSLSNSGPICLLNVENMFEVVKNEQ